MRAAPSHFARGSAALLLCSGAPWVVDKFMRFKLASLFAGAFDAVDFTPLPVAVPMPSSGDIARAAKLVLGAKRPLLIMGSQVRHRAVREWWRVLV